MTYLKHFSCHIFCQLNFLLWLTGPVYSIKESLNLYGVTSTRWSDVKTKQTKEESLRLLTFEAVLLFFTKKPQEPTHFCTNVIITKAFLKIWLGGCGSGVEMSPPSHGTGGLIPVPLVIDLRVLGQDTVPWTNGSMWGRVKRTQSQEGRKEIYNIYFCKLSIFICFSNLVIVIKRFLGHVSQVRLVIRAHAQVRDIVSPPISWCTSSQLDVPRPPPQRNDRPTSTPHKETSDPNLLRNPMLVFVNAFRWWSHQG